VGAPLERRERLGRRRGGARGNGEIGRASGRGRGESSGGADHTGSGAYEADLSGRSDRLEGGEPHVAAAIETEDRAAIMDSLILCKFLRGVFEEPYPEWARLLSAVSGWDVDAAELEATARRIVVAKRAFNAREGWTRADDGLPERFLSEPLEVQSGRAATLTRERLDDMIARYYEVRGLDVCGIPTREQMEDLRLGVLVL